MLCSGHMTATKLGFFLVAAHDRILENKPPVGVRTIQVIRVIYINSKSEVEISEDVYTRKRNLRKLIVISEPYKPMRNQKQTWLYLWAIVLPQASPSGTHCFFHLEGDPKGLKMIKNHKSGIESYFIYKLKEN